MNSILCDKGSYCYVTKQPNTFLLLHFINTETCLYSQHELIYLSINGFTLQEHAYSNILKILQPKKENFQIKNSDIFHISARNMDCWCSLEPPRRGGLCFGAE